MAVALDRAFRPHLGGVGILAGGTAGPALAEQVPALVEGDLDGLQTRVVVVAEAGPGLRPLEAVLLVGQLTDVSHDLDVIHCGTLPFGFDGERWNMSPVASLVATDGDPPPLIMVDAGAWCSWLTEHHHDSDGVWLVLAKKGKPGATTLTYDEALEAAMCFGWIDGQRRSQNDATFLQRFTPRRAAACGRSAMSASPSA